MIRCISRKSTETYDFGIEGIERWHFRVDSSAD